MEKEFFKSSEIVIVDENILFIESELSVLYLERDHFYPELIEQIVSLEEIIKKEIINSEDRKDIIIFLNELENLKKGLEIISKSTNNKKITKSIDLLNSLTNFVDELLEDNRIVIGNLFEEIKEYFS